MGYRHLLKEINQVFRKVIENIKCKNFSFILLVWMFLLERNAHSSQLSVDLFSSLYFYAHH